MSSMTGDVDSYDEMAGRRTALEMATRIAIECGNSSPDAVVVNAGKFADFIIENKRANT